MSASVSAVSAAASAAVAKVSGVGEAPVKMPSVAVTRTGRSVAALMATRASAIWLASIRNHAATVLHLLGFDHEKLTYRYAGRDFRLTDVHGHVVKDILA